MARGGGAMIDDRGRRAYVPRVERMSRSSEHRQNAPADDPEAVVRPGEPADAAIPKLLERYGERMYRTALRLCGQPQDAEDLVQETFLEAYRRWDDFEGRSSPTTWLYSIAARKCMRMRRRRAGEPERMESLEELLPLSGEGPEPDLSSDILDPADDSARRELRERLERAIASLPDGFRLPLVLRDIFEIPVAEVARVLGLKPETVKSRVHRARLRLRRTLLEALPGGGELEHSASRGVCLDLLRAKQEALDRGVPFPVGSEAICRRCRAIFATLDLARLICRELDEGEMPEELRRELARRLRVLQAGRSAEERR